MKNIIIIYILCIGLISAHESETFDRLGWHFGIGISGVGGFMDCETPEEGCDFEDDSFFALPTLNMVAEYGVTPQFSWSLEHQGYVMVALITMQGKYYLQDAQESAYIVGGIETIYAFGYGMDNTGAAKAGVGYAWSQNEIDVAVHKNANAFFSFTWRHKF